MYRAQLQERLAREHAAAAEAERQAREAQVAAAEAATRTAEKEARHARLRQQVKGVQRRILTQVCAFCVNQRTKLAVAALLG